jgi:hypothetical protein
MSNSDNLFSQLPYATYQFSLDGVPAGPLTVEQQDVLESRPGGDFYWVAGHVLGRRFYGTYAEDTRQFNVRAPVFGTYHWTFRGRLHWSTESFACPDAVYYEFLDAEYSILRIIVRHWDPNQPDQMDRVAEGTWQAWTCYGPF